MAEQEADEVTLEAEVRLSHSPPKMHRKKNLVQWCKLVVPVCNKAGPLSSVVKHHMPPQKHEEQR